MKRLSTRAAVGFTLLEIIVVMTIMMLIIGIGYASFTFLDETDPLEKPVQQLSQMSKYAMNRAVIQHRGMMIGFEKESFGVVGSSEVQMGSYTLPQGVKMEIRRWGSRSWEDAEGYLWRFGEQGICEPLKVRFSMDGIGSQEVTFHPLTGGITE